MMAAELLESWPRIRPQSSCQVPVVLKTVKLRHVMPLPQSLTTHACGVANLYASQVLSAHRQSRHTSQFGSGCDIGIGIAIGIAIAS